MFFVYFVFIYFELDIKKFVRTEEYKLLYLRAIDYIKSF